MQLEKQITPQLCTSQKKTFTFPHAAEYKAVSDCAKEARVSTEVF